MSLTYNNGDTMKHRLLTVVETPAYLAAAKGVLSEAERLSVVDQLACDPACGDVIRGGNGIRKMRFAIGGRGKSGGVRVIYFYYNQDMPAYLLTVFAKNERANLNAAEVGGLAKAAMFLRQSLKRKQ